MLALEQGAPGTAVRLFGAAEAIRPDPRGHLGYAHARGYDASVARARAELGESAFRSAKAAGAAMDIRQALALAGAGDV
jgi:hypothetical protein